MKSKSLLLIFGIINVVLGVIFILTSSIGIHINNQIAKGNAEISHFAEILGVVFIKFIRAVPVLGLIFGILLFILGIFGIAFFAKIKRRNLQE